MFASREGFLTMAVMWIDQEDARYIGNSWAFVQRHCDVNTNFVAN